MVSNDGFASGNSFLETNSQNESCRKLLNMWNSWDLCLFFLVLASLCLLCLVCLQVAADNILMMLLILLQLKHSSAKSSFSSGRSEETWERQGASPGQSSQSWSGSEEIQGKLYFSKFSLFLTSPDPIWLMQAKLLFTENNILNEENRRLLRHCRWVVNSGVKSPGTTTTAKVSWSWMFC